MKAHAKKGEQKMSAQVRKSVAIGAIVALIAILIIGANIMHKRSTGAATAVEAQKAAVNEEGPTLEEAVDGEMTYGNLSKVQAIDLIMHYGISGEHTQSEIEEAIESYDVDWTERATRTAQRYADEAHYSLAVIRENLVGDDMFSEAEADAACSAVVADWGQVALAYARGVVEFATNEGTDYTSKQLLRELTSDGVGFEEADAAFAVSTLLDEGLILESAQ